MNLKYKDGQVISVKINDFIGHYNYKDLSAGLIEVKNYLER